MPHGYPDWGEFASATTIYTLLDMGELAARLGSIDTFDRRGNVVWLDDFEAGLRGWDSYTSGTLAAVALSAVRARNGAYSVKLTGGSDGGCRARISHTHNIPVLSKLGIEWSLCVETDFDYHDLLVDLLTASGQSYYWIRYRRSQDDLQYCNNALTFQTFATNVRLACESTLFHTLKLVFDPTAREYVRFSLDNASYSLAGIPAYFTAAVFSPKLRIRINHYSRSGYNDAAYVDDVIYTQNEP